MELQSPEDLETRQSDAVAHAGAEKLFSPSEVMAGQRPARWRQAVYDAFGLEIDFSRNECERTATGGLWRSKAGYVDVVTSDLRFGHLAHNERSVRREPCLLVLRQNGGQCSLAQRGNEEKYVAGDLAVLDGSEAFEGDMSGQGGGVWLSMPLREVKDHFPHAQDISGLRIDGSTGVGAVASEFVNSLTTHIVETNEFEAQRLVKPLLDVLELAARERLGALQPATKRQALRSVRQYVADRLASRELTPDVIAEAHGVSRRQVDKWFQGESLSLSQYIWEQRLIACRHALRDPLQAHLPITQIALKWGFNSSAHFSRAFSKRFGVSPSRCRTLSLGQH